MNEQKKIKPLNKEQILISIDRLTKFKNPEDKYLRVFKDVILSNLITPKFSKKELDKMSYSELKNYAEMIINYSIKQIFNNNVEDLRINQILFDYETQIFNTTDETKILLQNKIDYSSVVKLIPDNTEKINLKWLKSLLAPNDITDLRKKFALKFPVETVVITEGITEEILLPEFSRLCDYDFDKNGVHIISAGGKAQVVKLTYKLIKELKIPVFILLDKDANENYNAIKKVLRPFDNIYILQCGEFEDLLPLSLIKKTLAYEFNNISVLDEPLKMDFGMVKMLEEIFKHRGMHEFKKSEFAKAVKNNLSSKDDITCEINEIIEQIKQTKTGSKVLVDN